MIYVTGDTHANIDIEKLNTTKFPQQKNLTKDDYLIICGDFGLCWDGSRREMWWQDWLTAKNFTTLWIDGNHENFDMLYQFPLEDKFGGKVRQIAPDIYHLDRGQVLTIDGKKIFCMGGACSVDKAYRTEHISWWPQEMRDDGEYRNATKNLEECGFTVDYILTHTAPADTVEYMSRLNLGIKNSVVEEFPLTSYLQWIVETVRYDKWFFGHFHIDAEIWRNQYAVLDSIRELHTGELIKNRC